MNAIVQIPGTLALSVPDVSVLGWAIAIVLVLVAVYVVLSQLSGTRRP